MFPRCAARSPRCPLQKVTAEVAVIPVAVGRQRPAPLDLVVPGTHMADTGDRAADHRFEAASLFTPRNRELCLLAHRLKLQLELRRRRPGRSVGSHARRAARPIILGIAWVRRREPDAAPVAPPSITHAHSPHPRRGFDPLLRPQSRYSSMWTRMSSSVAGSYTSTLVGSRSASTVTGSGGVGPLRRQRADRPTSVLQNLIRGRFASGVLPDVAEHTHPADQPVIGGAGVVA